MDKKGFTLVELIVVITILATLGTIAFISLQGYSSSSRDSVRISDVSNMKKVLELYKIDSGKYPLPIDPSYEVTYSGALVWTQGVFGEKVVKKVKKISNIPLDPLTKNEYTYSVLNTKKEFEIGVLFEGEISKNILSQTNAADKTGKAYITGTYNGKIAKAETSTGLFILAVPTIINSDLSLLDYQDIVSNNTLSYNGGSNLPGSYDGKGYTMTGSSTEVIVNDPLVYEGASIDELTDPNNTSNREELLTNLQNAYSGTVVSNDEEIKYILSSEPTDYNTASTIVNNSLGGSIQISSTPTGLPVCKFDETNFDNCVFGE